MEFVLHGLSAYSMISKKVVEGKIEFKDLIGSMMNMTPEERMGGKRKTLDNCQLLIINCQFLPDAIHTGDLMILVLQFLIVKMHYFCIFKLANEFR